MSIRSAQHSEVITSPALLHEEENETLEFSLRPQLLAEYIGQSELKANLEIGIAASKKRREPLDHVLLYGPPGLGKTTLAHIISRELQVNIKITSGPALEKQGDLAALLTNLQPNDCLFIDEIHRLRTNIEEVLYTAMEDYALDIVIGKGPSARVMRMDLPKFTLIGATTKAGMLSAPLRDRFHHIYKLAYYSPEEMAAIISRTTHLLECDIDKDALEYIASCARSTPRIANRLVKRIRDFVEVKHLENRITLAHATSALSALGVDHLGLETVDRSLLRTLIEKFQGGPVGLSTLAAATAEEEETIEDVYEPFLMQMGFIDRTPRGRMATKRAYEFLALEHLISE